MPDPAITHRVAVRVWMSPELRDQLLAEGGSKPVHPMRLIPDADGFQLVFMSVGGVLAENRPESKEPA
jgi:hypothetical protein